MSIFIVVALAAGALEFLASTGLGSFSSFGINSLIATVALVGATIIFFSRPDKSAVTSRNLVLIYLAGLTISIIVFLLPFAAKKAFPRIETLGSGTWTSIAILVLLSVGALVWMTGAARQAFKQVPSIKRPALRALAFTLCISLCGVVLPTWPVFLPKGFDRSTANAWELAAKLWKQKAHPRSNDAYLAEARREQQTAARLEGRQPRLLETGLASIQPRDPNKSNVFLVAVAGWGAQDVFLHETEQSVAILKSRFDIGSRAISLVNAEGTVDRHPLASIQNLSSALRAIGERMDRQKDVLILTMTSHGSRDAFALQFENLIYRDLDPATLKTLLDDAGIKNRILIVAACYSGIFVPVLKNDDTMIMTAASATRTSFGCASGRKWTYFGDAFFDHGLKQDQTLVGAFSIARRTIGQWEANEKLTPSDPQIFVGASIARRFPQIVGETEQQASKASETTAVSNSSLN